jgi:hypothetical protein
MKNVTHILWVNKDVVIDKIPYTFTILGSDFTITWNKSSQENCYSTNTVYIDKYVQKHTTILFSTVSEKVDFLILKPLTVKEPLVDSSLSFDMSTGLFG